MRLKSASHRCRAAQMNVLVATLPIEVVYVLHARLDRGQRHLAAQQLVVLCSGCRAAPAHAVTHLQRCCLLPRRKVAQRMPTAAVFATATRQPAALDFAKTQRHLADVSSKPCWRSFMPCRSSIFFVAVGARLWADGLCWAVGAIVVSVYYPGYCTGISYG